ncbi:MAG TPA: RlmE family RNA methyltransferase [Candidatus Margulisiibacteriota bacterium]|nr:RlmE family RNA methyltransferase [Candidatus Margulisiibacteriota bacterium]
MYQRKDAYYVRAKAAGLRSRAAFKLQELVRRGRLLGPGDVVVELGAWPGGWLQIAAAEVGPQGKVIGVDLRAIAPLSEPNAITVVGDINAEHTLERVRQLCDGKADVLLSDLAPKLSGVRARDAAQAQALADCVLQWAERILKTGGTLVVKLFMGSNLPQYAARLRTRFRDVHLSRPDATRKRSAEVYALATGFRGHPVKATSARCAATPQQ